MLITNFYFFHKNNSFFLILHKNNNLYLNFFLFSFFKNNTVLAFFKNIWLVEKFKKNCRSVQNNFKSHFDKNNYIFINTKTYNLIFKNNKNTIVKTYSFFNYNKPLFNYLNSLPFNLILKALFLNNVYFLFINNLQAFFFYSNKYFLNTKKFNNKNKTKNLLNFNLYLL